MKSNLQNFAEALEKHFQIPAKKWKEYACPTTFITREFRIDAVRLDGLMHERHGEFENEQGLSTFGIIEKEYGKGAATWIESVL